MVAENGPSKKRSLGRRKIEMKKIEKKPNLQVTFTKRRAGLFNKATELALLCGAHVAVLVQSPSGKIYTCGMHVDALINSFLADAPPPEMGPHWRSSAYDDAVTRLEMEKTKPKGKGESWWSQESFEGLELHELEEYLESLILLTDNVLKRADEMEALQGNVQQISDDGLSVDDYAQLYDVVFNYN